MKILIAGHRYELANFEHSEKMGQALQFIEKRPGEAPGTLVTTRDGTTNEEVLRVLIDRISSLNAKFPCRENSIALTHVETALLWLQKRTADRVARGVEGQAKV